MCHGESLHSASSHFAFQASLTYSRCLGVWVWRNCGVIGNCGLCPPDLDRKCLIEGLKNSQHGAPWLLSSMRDPAQPLVDHSPQYGPLLPSPPHLSTWHDSAGQSESVVGHWASANGKVKTPKEDGSHVAHGSWSPASPKHPHVLDECQKGAVSSCNEIFTTSVPANGGAAIQASPQQHRGISLNTKQSPIQDSETAEESKANGLEKVQYLEPVSSLEGAGKYGTEELAGTAEEVPSKLLPKSWAALVGVQGTKGRGRTTQVQARLAAGVGKSTGGNAGVQPRGLLNTGNSCFLNATLQALLSCPPFLHLILVLRSRTVPEKGYPTLRAFVDFAGEFELKSATEPKVLKVGHEDDRKTSGGIDVGKPFAPGMFDVVLHSFSPDQPARGTGRSRQEDAQEFLSHVMDLMHEELLRLEGTTILGQQTVVVDDDDWETVGPKNRTAVTRTHTFTESPLSDIFGGQLRSVVKTKGNKASATVQPFLILHLDILPDALHSVEDALKFFAAPESLEGYKATTGKGSEAVSASKAVKIQALPRVLLLHLMRFSYGAGSSSKLHKPVRFPLELGLGRELLVSHAGPVSEARKYELVATVTHHGKDPSGGHYTADCKQSDGYWLRFDDGVVSMVNLSRVLHDQAYVLFYKRASL